MDFFVDAYLTLSISSSKSWMQLFVKCVINLRNNQVKKMNLLSDLN